MSESQFIQEVRHRAVLLTGSFNPGKGITWVRKTDNIRLIFFLLEDTRKYLPGDRTQEEISAFWCRVDVSAEIKSFISCLGSRALVLRQRGRRGDIYSVPVLHYVVSHFIHNYMQGMPEITHEIKEMV